MKRLIIDWAYFFNRSNSYQKIKRFFYNFLENETYKYKKYFDFFMIMLIFLSVSILIHEVKNNLNDFLLYLNTYIISFIFFIEYILRLWVTSSVTDIIIKNYENDDMLGREFRVYYTFYKIFRVKLKYILSIKAIIDLLAIIPFFHELRLLRIFVLFRVFKLFRYARSFHMFTSALASKKFEFITLLMFSSIVIFVSSILIYVMEVNSVGSSIKTLFDAFYWSIVTISTVGYGDISPITPAGQFVAIVVIIAGIAVLAFTTSIVVSAFNEKLDETKEMKIINDIAKIKKLYIICGYENIAKEVAKQLVKNHHILVLDEDPERIANAKQDGIIALNYDPGNIDSYKKLRINIDTQVKAILCLRESDVENVYTTLTVRSITKDVYILSLLMNDIHRDKLSFAGVNEILYSKEFVGMIAREFTGNPVAFEVIHALRSGYTGIEIEEILLDNRILSSFITVAELNNVKFRLVLLGIYRQKHKRFFFSPLETTILEHGDCLVVIGNSVFIEEFKKYLHKKIRK